MFEAGRNIAMKVPTHLYEETVTFYRDIIKLPLIAAKAPNIAFQFGAMTLWIDNVPTLSQSEIWLEIVSDDVESARTELQQYGSVLCPGVEPLPDDFQGFWMLNPAQIVHLVSKN